MDLQHTQLQFAYTIFNNILLTRVNVLTNEWFFYNIFENMNRINLINIEF